MRCPQSLPSSPIQDQPQEPAAAAEVSEVAPKTPVRSGTARKQFCPETFTMAEENKAVAVGEKCLLYKHPINKFQLC